MNLTKRGNDVEAYYRNHTTDIDTVIGHSLGGSVSLALEEKYRDDKIGIPGVGIKQIKNIIPEKTDFLLLNTDTLFDFDIPTMHKVHITNNSLVTLSSVDVISPWGILTVSGENIINFAQTKLK